MPTLATDWLYATMTFGIESTWRHQELSASLPCALIRQLIKIANAGRAGKWRTWKWRIKQTDFHAAVRRPVLFKLLTQIFSFSSSTPVVLVTVVQHRATVLIDWLTDVLKWRNQRRNFEAWRQLKNERYQTTTVALQTPVNLLNLNKKIK